MHNNLYFLYYFFDSVIIRWLRVLLFFIIGILVYLNSGNINFIIQILPIYFFLILQEFFIHFKLEESVPAKKVSDEFRHVIDCVDFKIRVKLERHQSIESVIRDLLHQHDVKYFNSLLGIAPDFKSSSLLEGDILEKAKLLVLQVSGKYIHGIDFYAAYLLLLDSQNKILFDNDVVEEDVVVVLSWVRKQFKTDSRMHGELTFSGSGVFDFFVYGWSAQLARYASNFTQEVLSQKRIEPIGRVREYDLLVTALTKSSSSNALLIGQPGVGKTSLISQFVLDSDSSRLPKSISNKIVFKLYGERLLAGVNNEGDLEARFIDLFSELSHAGNIIVYVPNIENIFGGGGINIDISGVLADYLKSNKIKIIGSTTLDAYHKYIYPKQEIKSLFDIIEIQEPDMDDVKFMILEKSKELERINKISISYGAIKEACKLSDTYVNDGTAMPGRVIRLLDDTISYSLTHGISNISKKDVRDFMQTKTKIVLSEPTQQESEKLLNLEQEIHKRIVSQNEAVTAISDAMRRVRSGMKDEKKPIASFLFLGPTGVGKTETAKALAYSYFGSEDAMIRLDMSEYQTPESVERFLGSNSSGGQSTIIDTVMSNPFSLILLDEFEKAYPRILDLFLQVLDDGRLTDNIGRTASFNNTIIIATSNAGSEFIREAYQGNASSINVKDALLEKVQQSNIFKPELLNRFDDVIVFSPLSETDAIDVARLFLDEVITKVAEQQITLTYDDSVLRYIVEHAYSVEFGARNLRRFIEQSIENQLSKLLLSRALSHGGTGSITVENNMLVIKA